MSRIIIDMSPSLDGYIAGPGVTNEQALGRSGNLLHRWIGLGGASQTAADRLAVGDMFATAGAVVISRRMFDVGIDKRGEDGAFERPCFVVTRRPCAVLNRGPTVFTFVKSVPEAIRLARAAAGSQLQELELTSVTLSPNATHMTYKVVRQPVFLK